MITETDRKILKNKIKKILRESIFENGFFENMYPESSKGNEKKDDGEKKDKKYDQKVNEVMRWLDSAQELHSVLAYKLWPDKDKDMARSLFSKKYRGKDADGNPYSFSESDINKLFNMKDRFIDKIS